MSASMSHEASAEPNLTPILDMVFQLITFFMLVINFKAQSMDLKLHLPVIGTARPDDSKDNNDTDFIVLNVYPNGDMTVSGQRKDPNQYIPEEAARRRTRLLTTKESQEGDVLPTTVVLRADQTTPFKVLNHVIKICQDRGFRKFLLKTVDKEAQQKNTHGTT